MSIVKQTVWSVLCVPVVRHGIDVHRIPTSFLVAVSHDEDGEEDDEDDDSETEDDAEEDWQPPRLWITSR